MYQGSANAVVDYFSSHAYRCDEHENPADFALDVLIDASKTPASFQILAGAYVRSPMYIRIATFIADLNSDENEIYNSDDKRPDVKNRSWIIETLYVAQRTLRNAVRNPQLALSQTVVAIVIGILVGLVFFNIKLTIDTGVQNRLGAIFFIIVSQIFSTVTALEPLLKERVLFIHVRIAHSFFYFPYFYEFNRKMPVDTIKHRVFLLPNLFVIFYRCVLFHQLSFPVLPII
jgi:ATP-binding cassette subfamily G (WHITE) protein 2